MSASPVPERIAAIRQRANTLSLINADDAHWLLDRLAHVEVERDAAEPRARFEIGAMNEILLASEQRADAAESALAALTARLEQVFEHEAQSLIEQGKARIVTLYLEPLVRDIRAVLASASPARPDEKIKS